MKKLYTEQEVRFIVYLECGCNHLINKYKNKDIITPREFNKIRNFRKRLKEYSTFFKPETEKLKNIEEGIKDYGDPFAGFF